MIEEIADFFSELDMVVLGWAMLLWLILMIVLFRMVMQAEFYKFYIKIIIAVLMLPITYGIVWKMSEG